MVFAPITFTVKDMSAEDKLHPWHVFDPKGKLVERFAHKSAALAAIFASGGRVEVSGGPPPKRLVKYLAKKQTKEN